MVANGIAVEGPMLHGKEIPSFFQKVAVTNVHKRTKLLFKTSFDDSDYIYKCRRSDSLAFKFNTIIIILLE